MNGYGPWQVIQYASVDSTQRVAAALVQAGAPGRTAVIAARQTAGVGRKGDSWHDLPGTSLLCTVILRPPWPRPAPIVCYGMAAAIAVIEAIRDLSGGEAAVKWPNDIILGGRKVAGILGDATWTGQTLDALRLGIGVNVGGTRASFVARGLPDATSIAAATGRTLAVSAVLGSFLAHLTAWDDLLTVKGGQQVLAAWRAVVVTVGRTVRVTLANGRVWEGVAVGVTESGDLLLALPSERNPLTLTASMVQSLRTV